MDLSADIFRTRGRAAKPLTATVVRELEPSDLALLGQEKGSVPSPIKRLSERHHALARNLAMGMDHRQASIIANYSESRISILLSDPAFKELLAFYREPYEEVVRDIADQYAEMAKDANEELIQRLTDAPEDFSVGQLLEISKTGADRIGYGPQSTSNVNVNVDLASRLQEARKRVSARNTLLEG